MKKYDFASLNVLIVDDSAFMRKTLSKILTGFGFREIFEAADAVDGLSLLKQHSIDLVITDWVMDPLDGVEFTKIIRAGTDTPNPYVPILMLTGYTERYRIGKARDAGITEFLAKPISSEILFKRLVAVIETPRKFIETDKYKGPDRRRNRPDAEYKGDERRSDNLKKQVSVNDIDALFE